MQEVLEFLGAGLAGGAAVALLLGLAAWKWKALVSHWLLKDIEAIKANHQQQLEEKKAQYQRELESYRTSLIAHAEAIKAAQDVRKTMALRVAEKRFDAVSNLHRAFTGLSGKVNAELSTGYTADRAQRAIELRKSVMEYAATVSYATHCFSLESIQRLWAHAEALSDAVSVVEANTPNLHMLSADRIRSIQVLHAAAASVIEANLSAMFDMNGK